MRIVKEAKVRRAEILSAAYQLFTIKGYENTSVMDIIEKTGIAKGTLYYYFKSKEEILDAVTEQMIDLIVQKVRSIVSNASIDANTKLKLILQETNVEIDQNESLISEIHQVNNEKIHIRALNALIVKLSPVLEEIIHQGIKEGVFETRHPLESVEFLLVGYQYLFDSGFLKWSYDEYKRRALAMKEIFERVLMAKQGSMEYISEILMERFKAYQNTNKK